MQHRRRSGGLGVPDCPAVRKFEIDVDKVRETPLKPASDVARGNVMPAFRHTTRHTFDTNPDPRHGQVVQFDLVAEISGLSQETRIPTSRERGLPSERFARADRRPNLRQNDTSRTDRR